jgi:glycosyltransferase involved in cell wall biosynthesis
LWKALDLGARVVYFSAVCATHDAFIFGFNSTFFGYRELPLLKVLNKRIVYVYNGSDSRPPYLDGSVMALDRGLTIEQCIAQTRAKKATVRTIERYADAIVANPLSGHLHEKPFVSFLLTGIPYPLRQEQPIAANEAPGNQPLRILHSPSHPEAKGTPRVRDAIARLQQMGHRIEYVELTGRPNREVLRELARCDFVIDQLYSDQPMVGFGAEAAGFGKPSIIGGYGGAVFAEVIPSDLMAPVLYCHPDTFEAAVEHLIRDESFRSSLGQRARDFVTTRWSPEQVARNYLRVVNGSVPQDWMFDPGAIDYLDGACMPAERARLIVRKVVTQGGRQALQLADKPRLEHSLVQAAFADISEEARPDLVLGEALGSEVR